MKTTIKIVILCLAVASAIVGVIIFAKTKVAPPTELKAIEQYQDDIKELSKNITSVGTGSEEDSIFYMAIDRINVFLQEKKFLNSDSDTAKDNIGFHYAEQFIGRCMGNISQSPCNTQNHHYMLNQIAALQGLKHSDNTNVLGKDHQQSLNKISNIITMYRDAVRISGANSFRSYGQARADIAKAQKYSKDQYLSNCSELQNKLQGVRQSIHQSCLRYINGQISRLANYYNYSTLEDYENIVVASVEDVINDYDNNAAAIFGSKEDTKPLWDRAKSYYGEAIRYFK